MGYGQTLSSECVPDMVEVFFEKYVSYSQAANFSNYLFRGNGSAKYKLYPSALRSSSQKTLNYMSGIQSDEQPTSDGILKKECDAVYTFYSCANRIGLPIPGLGHLISSSTDGSCLDKIVLDGIIPEEYSELFALAQHYLIPTHFLDWTHDPLVALWFAAWTAYENIQKNKDNPSDNPNDQFFTVWVMDKNRIQDLELKYYSQSENKDESPVRFVIPPYANNPNLFGQKGVLTYFPHKHESEKLNQDLCYGYSFEQNLAFHLSGGNSLDDVPVKMKDYLNRFDLPVEQVYCILKYLESRGYEKCTIMPGYHHIKASLKARFEISEELKNLNQGRD